MDGIDFKCECTGAQHELACPLFAVGAIEFFFRSFVEFWPCVLCGRHRGTSIVAWCSDCGNRAKAINSIIQFFTQLVMPRAPLPATMTFSQRNMKRSRKRMEMDATRHVVRFFRAMGRGRKILAR